ncbi:MAG: winged helix-turn-helix transcriptional regulator, partial [Proteobacteria bacterium]|nr:winged helix-turn-helix transcriptional regulator [Pseudomonadota bacterium]
MLSVLDAISLNSKVSQRDLSKATGLNLAKVNFLLRRLAEKGFVKLRNISKNPNKLGYLYFLTPRGLTEKSRLTI